MDIRLARKRDLPVLCALDRHVRPDELSALLQRGRVYLAEEGGEVKGWLRYSLFWDNTPFLNLLFLLPDYRGQGHGRALLSRWEADRRAEGYPLVMTSTRADETARYFYGRCGYREIGAFTLPGEPRELLFSKSLP